MDTVSTLPSNPAQAPRTAVVTGAGRGIGRALALGLAGAGYDLGLVGRTLEHLEVVAGEVVDQARDAGVEPPRVVVVPVDVTDAELVVAAVRRLEQDLGGIGLLVNNAGVIEQREVPFAQDDVQDVWRVVETNVRGPVQVTHAVLPAMISRGSGRVVNINSGAGHRPSPAYTGYGISKGALARLTTLVHAQHGDQGVRIFDLAPGVVATDMTGGMPAHEERTDWTPPQVVVDLLLALASGRLDALSGRFVRAGADSVEDLLAHAEEIVRTDARTLRLTPYGPGDPLG
ncbi:SDR family oxidoreductase [Actinotalea sp. K2]|uniref:SDR family NAD(P)-dependent oxidoreductase n=1 Tax=Actinotalea sp. K2 TaxID=2939438 RepID=UPI002017E1FA|nr:SDR family NAD(P)-dependent oxidoreductase [Actinotalea sp. K2]MCL3861429.1 SDR family oxidoreductase [Actinotalea sp. K2]